MAMCSSLREYVGSKPPLVVFATSIVAFAVVLVGVSLYLQGHKTEILNPDIKVRFLFFIFWVLLCCLYSNSFVHLLMFRFIHLMNRCSCFSQNFLKIMNLAKIFQSTLFMKHLCSIGLEQFLQNSVRSGDLLPWGWSFKSDQDEIHSWNTSDSNTDSWDAFQWNWGKYYYEYISRCTCAERWPHHGRNGTSLLYFGQTSRL